MRTLTFLLLLTLGHGVDAGGIESVRLRAEAERSRVVFDLNSEVTYRAFQMKNPDRVVIDLQNVAYPKSLSLPATVEPDDTGTFSVLKRMRYAVRNESGLRIVLDLNSGVDLQHTVLPPRQDYGHRLVVDLYRQGGTRNQLAEQPAQADNATQQNIQPSEDLAASTQLGNNQRKTGENIAKLDSTPVVDDGGARALALLNGENAVAKVTAPPANNKTVASDKSNSRTVSVQAPTRAIAKTPDADRRATDNRAVAKKPPRNVVIAIDAGHGGHDVGAIGPKGTYEKNIVLQISRELAATINKQQGMRAILTRSNDNYVGLRDRMQRARQQEADLFISIHADAFKDRRVSGSSVYVLSQHGASSEAARWLAENENAADLVGGVSLGDKDDVVKSVLIDLSQTASIDASIDAADTVLAALKKIGKVHKPAVQHAGFMVLKSPDIPFFTS